MLQVDGGLILVVWLVVTVFLIAALYQVSARRGKQ